MASPTSKKKRVPIHGVLLLDKPVGLTSNDALVQSKRLLNAAKAGHTGTLDPFATGLLPLCFGEATKFAQDLLDADKTYETVVHLGITTTTGDTEGEVVANSEVNFTQQQVEAVVKQFQGEISQIPPMYSALKRDGKPLYEYARAGVVLEREARRVTIHQLQVMDFQSPFLTLRVSCSKGTYIRTLGEDIGAKLGCGAHLQALRRIQVGELTLVNATSLQAFAGMPEAERPTSLLPVDALLSSFPVITLPDHLATRFMHGQRLALGKEGISCGMDSGRVRVYRQSDQSLLGTAQAMAFGVLAPERLVSMEIHQPITP